MEPGHEELQCGPKIFTSSLGIVRATELSLGWNHGGSFFIFEISLTEGAVPTPGLSPPPACVMTADLDFKRLPG